MKRTDSIFVSCVLAVLLCGDGLSHGVLLLKTRVFAEWIAVLLWVGFDKRGGNIEHCGRPGAVTASTKCELRHCLASNPCGNAYEVPV